MKAILPVLSAIALLVPAAAQAEVRMNLRANVAPQCQVLSVSAMAGSPDFVVRVACNVERFSLSVLQPDGAVVGASMADNSAVSRLGDDAVMVSVENPGVQTLRITMDAPMAGQAPVVALQAG